MITLNVTAGERDFLYFTVTAPTGDDISLYPIQVGFGTRDVAPTVWIDPTNADDSVTRPTVNQIVAAVKFGTGLNAHATPSNVDTAYAKVGGVSTTVVRVISCGKVKFK